MSTLIIIALIAVGISILAKSGSISPYVAGGIAIAYGSINHFSYKQLFSTVILFYLIAYFANTWAETQGRSMTTMLNISAGANPYPVLLLKLSALLIFMLLPIPKPPFYIQGLVGIIIAAGLYYATTGILMPIIYQTIIFMTLGGMFNQFSDYQSYSMALIAAVVIPSLLHPDPPKSTIYDKDVDVSYERLAISFFLAYMTPGFSSNVIIKSLYLPGVSQILAAAILEAAIEGWALHIFISNQITSKTVLGDLLSLPELEWSSFTPYNSLKLVILCLPIIAALITLVTPALNVALPTLVPCVVLAMQSVMTCGLIWSIIFIGAGYWLHSRSGWNDRSYTGLLFMTQI